MCVVGLVSCASQHPATQVTVLIDAEPHVRGVATELVVHVTGGHDGETFLEAGDPITRPGPLAWPFDVTVTPAGGDATRLFAVEATVYDSGHRLVSQARLRGGYVRGEARHVTLTLEDACVGVTCATGLTCRNGRCVSIEQPMTDGGVRDANGDAGPTHCIANMDCDDDNICNGFETCVSGACVPGVRDDCDDHVGCTLDSCDGHQCIHTADDTRCTGGTCNAMFDCQLGPCTAASCVTNGCQQAHCNGNICERTFACAAGQTCCGSSCVPMGCDDGMACTTDYCAASGMCAHDVHTGPCDDHDICTPDGACTTSGACMPAARMTCDDGNPCTTDSCDAVTGCTHVNNAASCSDDNPCTVGDSCGGGACVPGVANTCDDDVACTTDMCSRTVGCRHVASDTLCGPDAACNATTGCQPTNACSVANCQPTPGTCETATCVGGTCQRGTMCNGTQMCCGMACVPMGCADMTVCTDDACNAATSMCVHTPAARGCDDGDACTTGDTCTAGACHGAPMLCSDLEECTGDMCMNGVCIHQSLEGQACTPVSECAPDGTCSLGHCIGIVNCPPQRMCCLGACNLIGDCLMN